MNSWLVTGSGAVALKAPAACSDSISHITIDTQSFTWIQGMNCRPEPIEAPSPILNGRSMRASAPPDESSTRPVRASATRVDRPCAAAAASSHSTHSRARKSDPGPADSVMTSSPRAP